jgi:hypothetical protein
MTSAAARFIGLYLLYSFLGLYLENVLPDALVCRSGMSQFLHRMNPTQISMHKNQNLFVLTGSQETAMVLPVPFILGAYNSQSDGQDRSDRGEHR